jgi:hypothetical protein
VVVDGSNSKQGWQRNLVWSGKFIRKNYSLHSGETVGWALDGVSCFVANTFECLKNGRKT